MSGGLRKAVVPAVFVFLLVMTVPLQYLARQEVVVGIPSEHTHSHASEEEESTDSNQEYSTDANKHTSEEGHLATEVELGINLIPNYGFEVGTYEQIWGWTGGGSGQGEVVYRDDEVAHGGLASAAVSTNGATVEGAGWIMRLEELPSDHAIFFDGYLRTEGLIGEAYLKITLEIREEGDDRPRVLGMAVSDTVSGDNEWALRETSLYVPPEATGVWLEIGMIGQGRAWFDDLSLVVEEPE